MAIFLCNCAKNRVRHNIHKFSVKNVIKNCENLVISAIFRTAENMKSSRKIRELKV